MEYKIISTDAVHGRITVLYFHEEHEITTLVLDVPIVNGEFVTGDPLKEFILNSLPSQFLDRKTLVASTQGFHKINEMMEEHSPRIVDSTYIPEFIPQPPPSLPSVEQ
jgi:hypothetical protein